MGKQKRNIIVVSVQSPEGLRCRAAHARTGTFIDSADLRGGGAYIYVLTRKELRKNYPNAPKFDKQYSVFWIEPNTY
jgi:hypothetical protein